MSYKIQVFKGNTSGVAARYMWELYIYNEKPNPAGSNWWYVDGGDSKYKWNAERSAKRALKRHKESKLEQDTLVYEEYFE